MPKVFSYGSLQRADVQIATFGHALTGQADRLPGFALGKAPNRAGLDAPGLTNAEPTGSPADSVAGVVFAVTDSELQQVDRYEARDDYARREVTLASGTEAWVYVYAG